MKIGAIELPNGLFVAPMAGVTDRPFRQLCKRLGAGYAVSEMVTSRRELWNSLKTSRRADHDGEAAPIAVQIAGVDPSEMADAARYNIDRGAQVIDINMGCPAKKVCNVAAGSALLRDESLVRRILEAVVSAVEVPVTLKLRTGWSPDQRNALAVCTMAQDLGVQVITLHGRTRACAFGGSAEYDTIARVRQALHIPLIANGDIDSPEKAAAVLRVTGADAVMVGRAALRRPWLFGEIQAHLEGRPQIRHTINAMTPRLLRYLDEHHAHHGAHAGVRTARKRISYLFSGISGGAGFCDAFMLLETPEQQRDSLERFLGQCAARHLFFEYSQTSGGQADVHG